MKPFTIEATKSTPSVLFDPESGMLSICGESYPENAAKFYAPLFGVLETYFHATPQGAFHVDLEFIYFNTSSSKILFNLFDLFDKAADSGQSITVNWRYNTENDTAKSCGEEFQEDVSAITFNLIEIN